MGKNRSIEPANEKVLHREIERVMTLTTSLLIGMSEKEKNKTFRFEVVATSGNKPCKDTLSVYQSTDQRTHI